MASGNLLIRCDANFVIGTGHVMRCLALAQCWQEAGGRVSFLLGPGGAEIHERLSSQGVEVRTLSVAVGSSEDAEETARLTERCEAAWLVLDGSDFSAAYRQIVRRRSAHVLLLDDHGIGAPYDCDVLLNFAPDAAGLYPDRQSDIQYLLGPEFALLRQEFVAGGTNRAEIPALARNVLVTFGGSDPNNVTLRVLGALRQIADSRLEVRVVVGSSNPHMALLDNAAQGFPCGLSLLKDVRNMPELMAWAELGVSAGGGTCFEMAFMKVPMFLITIASNHDLTVKSLFRRNAAIGPGWFHGVTQDELASSLMNVIGSQVRRQELADHASRLVDGRGAHRVVDVLCTRDRARRNEKGPMRPA